MRGHSRHAPHPFLMKPNTCRIPPLKREADRGPGFIAVNHRNWGKIFSKGIVNHFNPGRASDGPSGPYQVSFNYTGFAEGCVKTGRPGDPSKGVEEFRS